MDRGPPGGSFLYSFNYIFIHRPATKLLQFLPPASPDSAL
jgi:hypothetical protein